MSQHVPNVTEENQLGPQSEEQATGFNVRTSWVQRTAPCSNQEASIRHSVPDIT